MFENTKIFKEGITEIKWNNSFRSFHTFLEKNSPKREDKNYDLKYVINSLEYSQKNKWKIYLSNQIGHRAISDVQAKLFHPRSNI